MLFQDPPSTLGVPGEIAYHSQKKYMVKENHLSFDSLESKNQEGTGVLNLFQGYTFDDLMTSIKVSFPNRQTGWPSKWSLGDINRGNEEKTAPSDISTVFLARHQVNYLNLMVSLRCAIVSMETAHPNPIKHPASFRTILSCIEEHNTTTIFPFSRL